MPGMKLQQFKGMLPRVSAEHLPDGFAQLAQNVKLYSGDLIPYRAPLMEEEMGYAGAKTIYKDEMGDWQMSPNDLDIVSVSTGNGADPRTYTTEKGGRPMVDTFRLGLPVPPGRLTASTDNYIPAKVVAFSRRGNVASLRLEYDIGAGNIFYHGGFLISVAGMEDVSFNLNSIAVRTSSPLISLTQQELRYFNPGADVAYTETDSGEVDLAGGSQIRNYVYTFITATGEESVPSVPSIEQYVTEGVDVMLSGLPTKGTEKVEGTNDRADRTDIKGIRLYRTVSSAGGTQYLRVKTLWFPATVLGDLPAGHGYTESDKITAAGTFVDRTDVNTLSIPLSSEDYDEPPRNMVGLREMHNNILVGFFGNELCFSFPSKPHAWPERYRLSLTHKIVAVEATQGSLLVLTDEYPYIVSGNDPATMTAVRLNTPYACLSKRSVVVLDNGVMWATHAGLAMYQSGGGLQLASQAAIDWDMWGGTYNLPNMAAWYYEGKYLASDGKKSFIFYPDQQAGYMVALDTIFAAGYYDRDDGEFYYVSGDVLYQWDSPDSPTNLEMTWTSKRFITPDKMNYGAAKLESDAMPAEQLCTVSGVDPSPAFGNTASVDLACAGETPTVGAAYFSGTIRFTADTVWNGEFRVNNGVELGTRARARFISGGGEVEQVWRFDGVEWDFSTGGYSHLFIDAQAGAEFTPPIGDLPMGFEFEGELTTITTTYSMRRSVPPSQCCEVVVRNNKPFNLPAGFKDDTYDITITSRSRVRSIHVAETRQALKGI